MYVGSGLEYYLKSSDMSGSSVTWILIAFKIAFMSVLKRTVRL